MFEVLQACRITYILGNLKVYAKTIPQSVSNLSLRDGEILDIHTYSDRQRLRSSTEVLRTSHSRLGTKDQG